jgi:hypothetical protein
MTERHRETCAIWDPLGQFCNCDLPALDRQEQHKNDVLEFAARLAENVTGHPFDADTVKEVARRIRMRITNKAPSQGGCE